MVKTSYSLGICTSQGIHHLLSVVKQGKRSTENLDVRKKHNDLCISYYRCIYN